MYDRVAEVLAERAKLDHGAAAGLTLSVALHAGITAAVVYAALHHPPPEMTNVLTIKFASTAPVAAPVTTKPPALPIHPAKPAPTPLVQQPLEAPKPVEKPVVVKNAAPPDTFGRSTKKPSAMPIPQPHTAAPPQPPVAHPATPQASSAPAIPGVANVNDIAPGASGVTGIEGGDFPYTIYIERMKSLIGTHWFRPQAVSAAPATIHFVINRDGSIRDVTVETASGNGTFDRAAQRAVIETSPLPPLPFGYNGTYLGVHLTFR
jgi:protein TonB